MPECKKCDAYVPSDDIQNNDVDCSVDGCPYNSSGGSFLLSAAVGAVTGSAILGGLVGGDFLGGILGDSLDGDLMD